MRALIRCVIKACVSASFLIPYSELVCARITSQIIRYENNRNFQKVVDNIPGVC